MDNMQYLTEISATSKTNAVHAPAEPLFSSKMKKFLIAAVILLIGILIFAAVSGSKSTQVDLGQLLTRTTNLVDSIDTYQKKIKSTSLRASSTSMRAILVNLSSSLTSAGIEATTTADETEIKTTLDSNLNHAWLIGSLDRVYSTQMSYELKLLLLQIQTLISASTDTSTTTYLTEAYETISPLLTTFTEYD